ncbi:uncharacterized protein CLUP02_03600 [Colletotrichum lupini]|uniref:Uncharacterized protein n=1 Tax=Colletotrichum lupini TaxID=145971 RepID=A0A9Q8WCI2_9PEZI|nr:uncharacterized protein CLUP02_03600 [Colletotrichum lupini]UQC78126.1 hypothetical protein CLUP02_03600 [Colletotrichum lupini]
MTTRRDRIASTSSRPAYNSFVFACPSSTSPSVSSQYSTRPTQRTSAGTTNDAGTLAQLSLQPHRTPHIHIELFCRPTMILSTALGLGLGWPLSLVEPWGKKDNLTQVSDSDSGKQGTGGKRIEMAMVMPTVTNFLTLASGNNGFATILNGNKPGFYFLSHHGLDVSMEAKHVHPRHYPMADLGRNRAAGAAIHLVALSARHL